MSHQHHEGVSCDSCMKGNFRGRRYKCLICFDYDSCSSCYENGVTSNRHTTDHPMQCILTRSDYELFYGGESIPHDVPQSFTCPFCGRHGLTESSLQEHVASDHSDCTSEVICAICAAIPGGEANNVTDDFAAHLQLEHRNPQREMEEPQTAIRGRRAPHPSRSSLNSSRSSRRSTQMQYSSASSGLTSLSPAGAAAAAAAAAAAVVNGSSSGQSVGSGSGARDMDPIAELLSQLSGVRRAANQSNSSQLQQLQMQLHLDRHSNAAAAGPSLSVRQTFAQGPGPVNSVERVPIERVIRRHPHSSQHQQTSSGNNNNSSASQVNHLQQHVNHVNQLMAGASVAGNEMPYIVLMDQNPNMSQLSVNGIPNGISGQQQLHASQQQANLFQTQSYQNHNAGRFLLSRCNETNLSEAELAASEVAKADKSLFIQELILTTLSDPAAAPPAPAVRSVSRSPVTVQSESVHQPSLPPLQSQEQLTTSPAKDDKRLGTPVQDVKEELVVNGEAVETNGSVVHECGGIGINEDPVRNPEEKEPDRGSSSESAASENVVPVPSLRSLISGSYNTSDAPAASDVNSFVDTVLMSQQQQQQQRLSSVASSNSGKKQSSTATTTTSGAASSSTGLLLPQPLVQMNRTSSQSTWTDEPTRVSKGANTGRRRTSEHHNMSRNGNRTDRLSGASSASGPTHPLKRGLSQPHATTTTPAAASQHET